MERHLGRCAVLDVQRADLRHCRKESHESCNCLVRSGNRAVQPFGRQQQRALEAGAPAMVGDRRPQRLEAFEPAEPVKRGDPVFR
jgi:hypothetical protein